MESVIFAGLGARFAETPTPPDPVVQTLTQELNRRL